MEKRALNPSRKTSGFPLDLAGILTGIDHGLDHNVKLARAPPMPTHWAHRVIVRNDPTITRRPRLAPKVDRTNISGGDTFIRQCPLIGDSLYDE